MKKYKFIIDGSNYDVEIKHAEDQTIELELNGAPYTVTLDKEVPKPKTPKLVRQEAVPSTDQGAEVKANAITGTIKSPLPGTILDIFVKSGDKVATGQRILLLEAMKMENNIESDKTGTVTEIKVSRGDAVMEGDVLIIIGA